jgi:hypothetical protein
MGKRGRKPTPGIIEIGGERFYTAQGLAVTLHMNEKTIRRYHLRGILPGTRLAGGRAVYFTEAAVKAVLRGETPPAAPTVDQRPGKPIAQAAREALDAAHGVKGKEGAK